MGRSTRTWLSLSVVSAVLLLSNKAFAYMVETHKVINKAIFGTSALTSYFKDELKLPLTSSQTFQGQDASNLLQQGGYDEDSKDSWCGPTPYPRAYNHFHDPLRGLEYAGFTPSSLNELWYDGISSILYAQYDRLATPPNLKLLQCPETVPNYWTWDKAYLYFKIALKSQYAMDREEGFAKLFTGLGHLTHLVADASVPEHTRNDAHVFRCYEDWCADNLPKVYSPIDGVPAFRDAFPPDQGIFAQTQGSAFGSGPLSPISNLWDSYPGWSQDDQGYNGALGAPERLAGLADYSNFNYFSNDTVFSGYAYPSRSGSVPYVSEVTALVGTDGTAYPDRVVFFRGRTSDNIDVPHLAAADLLYQEWSRLLPGDQRRFAAHLDDYCYKDYASNLVPRAVSYGTALVNYFFRAKFEVVAIGNQLTVKNTGTRRAKGTVTVYADVGGIQSSVFTDTIDLQPDAFWTLANPFSPPVTPGLRYLLVFDGVTENVGAITVEDKAVGGKVFTWTQQALPRTTRAHSSQLAVPGYMVPYVDNSKLSTPLWQGSRIGCSCHFVHNSPYPIQLAADMTNLELCKICHGANAVGNPSPSWSPPRILVSPDAVPPDAGPTPGVDTFNPHNGDTVSGNVQFLLEVHDQTHSTQGPIKYRMDVWDAAGSHMLVSHPQGPYSDLVSGWTWATALWFLRDWQYSEKLVWDSRAVPNGTYLFRFHPMSNPEIYLPIRTGWPAELLLTVTNTPGM